MEIRTITNYHNLVKPEAKPPPVRPITPATPAPRVIYPQRSAPFSAQKAALAYVENINNQQQDNGTKIAGIDVYV